jgi:broad specificity phosphatase PhoE
MINPQSEFRNPQFLWLVRHGESTANLARLKAETEKLMTIDFHEREPDVPLSEKGIGQSIAIGRWFKFQQQKPTVIYSSPYLRTLESMRLIVENSRLSSINIMQDERLRERELGIFDRLTKLGAMQKYPEECEKRERLGKFYHRPPGGESWIDVISRLRSFAHTEFSKMAGERVLIITHEVVIRCFRYILENLTEHEVLAIDRACDVANGAITAYEFDENGCPKLYLDNILP